LHDAFLELEPRELPPSCRGFQRITVRPLTRQNDHFHLRAAALVSEDEYEKSSKGRQLNESNKHI